MIEPDRAEVANPPRYRPPTAHLPHDRMPRRIDAHPAQQSAAARSYGASDAIFTHKLGAARHCSDRRTSDTPAQSR
ncbi:MAG TPA: hypothetical protein VFZ66_00025 [Herpetosiphonaceae bacterium]